MNAEQILFIGAVFIVIQDKTKMNECVWLCNKNKQNCCNFGSKQRPNNVCDYCFFFVFCLLLVVEFLFVIL